MQSEHVLPPLRQTQLLDYFVRRVDAAVAPFPQPEVFHEHDFNNMLGTALRRLVRTPRDAVRVANALPAAVEAVAGDVALADVIGLEALRVLAPNVHARLTDLTGILTGDRLMLGNEAQRAEEDKGRVEAVIADSRDPDAVRRLLGQLFPKADQALGGCGRGFHDERRERREGRVSVPEVFDVYVHRTLDDDAVAASYIRKLFDMFGDPARLRERLEALSPTQRADALDRLLDYKDEFRPGQAYDVASAVLPLGWDLPERPSVWTGKARGSARLRRLIGNLLLAEAPADRGPIAQALVEAAPDLSTQVRLVQWFGTHPSDDSRDPDAEMIAEDRTQALLEDLRAQIIDAPPERLADEPALRSLLAVLQRGDPERAQAILQEKTDDEAFMLALLRANLAQYESVTSGEAAVRRDIFVRWEDLVSQLGDGTLRTRLESLRVRAAAGDLEPDTQAALDEALGISDGRVEPRASPY